MTDRLGEALQYAEEDVQGNAEVSCSQEPWPTVVAAARNWHTMLKHGWEENGYFVIPVDALTDTAESEESD